jgi:hypothetical protein
MEVHVEEEKEIEEQSLSIPPLPPRIAGRIFDCVVCRSPVVKKKDEDVIKIGDDGESSEDDDANAVWWYFVCTNERCGKVYTEIPERANMRQKLTRNNS